MNQLLLLQQTKLVARVAIVEEEGIREGGLALVGRLLRGVLVVLRPEVEVYYSFSNCKFYII